MQLRPCCKFCVSISYALCVFAAGLVHAASATQTDPTTPVTEDAESRGRQELRERFEHEHTDEQGRVRADLAARGQAHARRMQVAPHIGVAPRPPVRGALGLDASLLGSQWRTIGPAPLRDNGKGQIKSGTLSGLVTDIAIDPGGQGDAILYAATDAGGLWKSVDAGATWTPKTDAMPALSMGAVALDPSVSTTVYGGSGSLFNLGDFNAAGVYRSTDGGETWQVLNPASVFTNVGINRIVVPSSGVVLVGSANGLVRLTANGTQFTQPLAGVISDLKVDTANRSIVYAAVAGSGIFKSTDSGASFEGTAFFSPQSSGLPNGLAFGGVVFAQSTQPDANTFYVTAILTAGQPLLFCGGPFPNPTLGLYRSTNAGRTWSEIKQGPELPASLQLQRVGTQTLGYDQTLGVDPQNPRRFYFGLRGMYATNDGGINGLRDANASTKFPCPSTILDHRVDLGKGHSDHHAIAFSPQSHWPRRFPGRPPGPTTVFLGNDGGLISSFDQGSTFAYRNGNLGTILVNVLDMGRGSRANNKYSYGTAQDNGLFSHTPAQPGTEWVEGADSDGVTVAVDPVQPRHAIGTDNLKYYTTTDGLNWATSAALPGGTSPIVFDPNGRNAYAASGTQVLQSRDSGATYLQIGTFATGVRVIAQSPADSNTVWLALGDGTLAYTKNALGNGGVTWSLATGRPNAPFGQGITALAIDPRDTRRLVAVYPGFSGVDATKTPSRHVFQSTDAGATWSDISGVVGGGPSNLPDLPYYAVVIDPATTPHTVIVAGDGGVFQSLDAGSSWARLGPGLPPVQVKSMVLDFDVRPEVLRIGTWGRSAYELVAPSTLVTGNPHLIQGNWGTTGNFEMLVPQWDRIGQFSRDNDDPAFAWHSPRDFAYVARPGQLGQTPRSVTFVQSNFKGDGVHGNFETIVRVAAPIATISDHLDFWYFDSSALRWNGPFPIVADNAPIDTVTGDPSFLQGNWGTNGNFEVLVPRGNMIREYFRNNDDPAFAWHFLREFGYPVRPNEIGPTPRSVTFIQSSFKGDGTHGNFEAIVRVAPALATDPDYLDFFFLDSRTSRWNGPFPILVDGQRITGMTGDPTFIQSNWGMNGNFELLVPQGNVVKQYVRDNDDPQFTWRHLRDFGYPTRPGELGPKPVGVSFIQSNFKGDGTHGNFEAVVHVAPALVNEPDRLDFWYLDSRTSQWHGPFPLASVD
jgi:photosystem II stability/assembly factor-like uncharacterized protein